MNFKRNQDLSKALKIGKYGWQEAPTMKEWCLMQSGLYLLFSKETADFYQKVYWCAETRKFIAYLPDFFDEEAAIKEINGDYYPIYAAEFKEYRFCRDSGPNMRKIDRIKRLD